MDEVSSLRIRECGFGGKMKFWSSARQQLGYCVLEIKLNHNGYRYGMWGALTDAYSDFILIPCCVVLVSYPLTAKWVNGRFIL